jgi:hypothetical protein
MFAQHDCIAVSHVFGQFAVLVTPPDNRRSFQAEDVSHEVCGRVRWELFNQSDRWILPA